MENASKALLIAGGILLALLTISLVMIMYNNLQSMQNAQEQKLATEQLLAFNKEYEAYNKSLLYGTDVITVVNKAINNNRNMDIKPTEEKYYVNVIIKTNLDKEFKTKIIKVDNTKKKGDVGYEEDVTSSYSGITALSGITVDTVDKIQGACKLGDWDKNGYLVNNTGVINFFNQNATDTKIDDKDNNLTYLVYSALTDFKKTIFTCSNIEYSEITGRVKQITFVECVKTP